MTEALSGEQPSFANLSMDEIFTHHSVHSVQSLHKEYHNNAKKAKAALHSLVGKKYRDLIRIAEDIEKMHNTSKSIDNNLTDLSYETPKHVSFGTNSYAKFDSHVRRQRSKEAQHASESTIFHNIVSNKLLPFDLKLQTNATIKTSAFVHMAKVYYTLCLVFRIDPSNRAGFASDFSQYKSRFIDYLEHLIASCVTSSRLLNSSIIAQSDTQYMESDTVDLFDNPLDDEYDESFNNEEEEDLDIRRYSEGSSAPMYNYIVAYIILKHGDRGFETLEDIAHKIIDLRLVHLQNLIENATEKDQIASSNLNFSYIITFAESTYSCIRKYFFSGSSSIFSKNQHSKYFWKVCELIGFNSWFETEEVAFDMHRYSHLDETFLVSLEGKQDKLSDCILRILNPLTSGISHDQKSSLESTNRMLSLFHNFVIACRKAEVLAEAHDSVCLTVRLFSAEQLPQKFLDHTMSLLCNAISQEEETLKNQILKEVTANLSSFSIPQFSHTELFDEKLIDTIDHDFESYFEQILSYASTKTNTKSDHDSVSDIINWLEMQSTLAASISVDEPSIVNDITKTLNKAYTDVGNFESWGTFKVCSMTSKLSQVTEQSQQSLQSHLHKLLDEISAVLKNGVNREESNKLYYMLNLVHSLKMTTSLQKDESLMSHLSTLFGEILNHLLHLLLSKDDPGILNTSNSAKTSKTETIPQTPLISLESSIERLSSEFLSSCYLGSDKLFDIIVSPENRSTFIAAKNKWIVEVLIESYMHAFTKSQSKTAETQPEIEKAEESNTRDAENTPVIPIEQDSSDVEVVAPLVESNDTSETRSQNSNDHTHQSIADAAFLFCFTSKDPLTLQNDEVSKYLERVKEVTDAEIDSSEIEIILRGVNERYKATKNLYLPLSLN